MKKLLIAAAVVVLTGTSAFAGPSYYHTYLPTPQGFGNSNHLKYTAVGVGNTANVIQTGTFTRNSADISEFGYGNSLILVQD